MPRQHVSANPILSNFSHGHNSLALHVMMAHNSKS